MTVIRWVNSQWEVGHYSPNGLWVQCTAEDTVSDAMASLSYLNGGLRPDLADALLATLSEGRISIDVLSLPGR